MYTDMTNFLAQNHKARSRAAARQAAAWRSKTHPTPSSQARPRARAGKRGWRLRRAFDELSLWRAQSSRRVAQSSRIERWKMGRPGPFIFHPPNAILALLRRRAGPALFRPIRNPQSAIRQLVPRPRQSCLIVSNRVIPENNFARHSTTKTLYQFSMSPAFSLVQNHRRILPVEFAVELGWQKVRDVVSVWNMQEISRTGRPGWRKRRAN